MQQRRGTASQWTSANPILNAGEIGWESDTNKFKIGDGTNHWANLDYFSDINSTINPSFGTSITFEGATADSYETTLQVTDPTADRTITFQDASGTVAFLSDLGSDLTASSTTTFTNKSISLTTNTITGTKAEFNSAISDADFATIAGTETLTGKTLTSPVISGLTISDGSVVIEGTTANDHETTLSFTDPTADRTITFPDDSGTVAFTSALSSYAPLSGATFTGAVSGTDLTLSGNLTVNGTTTNINSTNLVVEDKNIVLGDTTSPADNTADGGGITLKGTTDKTFNWVDSTDAWTSSEHINIASGKSYYINGTALKDFSETLTNKTLTSPVISSISNTGTLTLPTTTDTLVGRATTDTLSGKSISLTTNTITGTIAEFNTALSDADFSTLAGSETLSNKTLASAVGTTSFTINATGELRLADTDSSHYVGFKSPATVTANKVWTLPASDGSTGQVLSTNGSGTLSWTTPAAGAAFSELLLIGC